MKTIWKFKLSREDYPGVQIPSGFKVLHVGMQDGEIMLWALVDPHANISFRTFRIVGTGNQFADYSQWKFIGTVFDGPFVWHVFE